MFNASNIVLPTNISPAIAAECVIPEHPTVSTNASCIIPSLTFNVNLHAPCCGAHQPIPCVNPDISLISFAFTHLPSSGIEALKEVNGIVLITADHGNSEQMIDYKTGEPHTAHTTNPVPLMLFGMENVKLNTGCLADLAPTMLDIMGLEKPQEMLGNSLLVRE